MLATQPTFFFTMWDGPTQPGSRDPLGLIPVWSRLGRELVPHVRTTAGDLEGWLTLLLAVATVQKLLPEMSAAERSRVPSRVLIHQVEKLIGYARLFEAPSDIRAMRGQNRMVATLKSGVVPMNQPVLDNPISAGMWGQISASAREAGLLTEDRRVTPDALWGSDFQWRFAPIVDPSSDLMHLLTGAGATYEPAGKHRELTHALKAFFPPTRASPTAMDSSATWTAFSSAWTPASPSQQRIRGRYRLRLARRAY